MGEPTGPLAILFADLGGSTRLYDTLGDAPAQRITARCLERIAAVVERHRGRVIKTIGDEVMATFDDAGDAALAALAIVATIRIAADLHEGRLGIHVGFHVGPVIREHGDVFGDAVNVAARMVALAVDGEVLTTRAGAQALPADLARRARSLDRRAVDGKREEFEVFQLVEESPDRTTVTSVPLHQTGGPGRLVLECEGWRWVVDESHPALTIGRSPENDVRLSNPEMSRRHSRIRLRHGKFVLIDESSNGTLVRHPDGKTVRIHREDLILPASGSLGVAPVGEVAGELPIHFRLEDG